MESIPLTAVGASQEDGESIFRVLVVTDNHLGHRERDVVRGNDSFVVFEEILQMATKLEVDFIAHAGDLFDLHKPSRATEFKIMNLLKKYCMGDAPIQFEVLNSNDTRVFPQGSPNFLDPNVNVSIPIFIIHGNHDDPGEESNLSPIDILSAARVVNYFGRADNLDEIKVAPILLRKGDSQVALYGLGSIRDERLHRCFRGGKVEFLVPESPEGEEDDGFFSMFMIHQNRHKGNVGGVPTKNCIPEQMLPAFLNLVIWGHEHDCQIDPRESLQGTFHVIQPGSSCVTSLSAGEAYAKHICLLEICTGGFRSTALPLRSLRPFEHDEVCLAELGIDGGDEGDVLQALTQEAEVLIQRAYDSVARREEDWKTSPAAQLLGVDWRPEISVCQIDSSYGEAATANDSNEQGNDSCPVGVKSSKKNVRTALGSKRTKGKGEGGGVEGSDDSTSLPIIRLRVEHTGFDTISNQRFGSQFVGRVANPEEILHFYKRKKTVGAEKGERRGGAQPSLELTEADGGGGRGGGNTTEIQDLVVKFLGDAQGLGVLPEPDMNVAVQKFVYAMESSAIDRFVERAEAEAAQLVRKKREELKAKKARTPDDLLENEDGTPPEIMGPREIRAVIRQRTEEIRNAHLAAEGEDVSTAKAAVALASGGDADGASAKQVKREEGDEDEAMLLSAPLPTASPRKSPRTASGRGARNTVVDSDGDDRPSDAEMVDMDDDEFSSSKAGSRSRTSSAGRRSAKASPKKSSPKSAGRGRPKGKSKAKSKAAGGSRSLAAMMKSKKTASAESSETSIEEESSVSEVQPLSRPTSASSRRTEKSKTGRQTSNDADALDGLLFGDSADDRMAAEDDEDEVIDDENEAPRQTAGVYRRQQPPTQTAAPKKRTIRSWARQ